LVSLDLGEPSWRELYFGHKPYKGVNLAKKALSQQQRPQQSLAFDYLHSVVASELELTYRTLGVKPDTGKHRITNADPAERVSKDRRKVVAV